MLHDTTTRRRLAAVLLASALALGTSGCDSYDQGGEESAVEDGDVVEDGGVVEDGAEDDGGDY